jgi:hypothetical protein
MSLGAVPLGSVGAFVSMIMYWIKFGSITRSDYDGLDVGSNDRSSGDANYFINSSELTWLSRTDLDL